MLDIAPIPPERAADGPQDQAQADRAEEIYNEMGNRNNARDTGGNGR